MASYRLLIKTSAVKELESLPQKDRRRIVRRVQALAENPRPPGAEKLTGVELYRVRQGDYRVLYEIADAAETITVIKVGNRRDVYR
ncbi:MAG: type II toxin-antitoxin system RelE/ParE family toxin [bacterium]